MIVDVAGVLNGFLADVFGETVSTNAKHSVFSAQLSKELVRTLKIKRLPAVEGGQLLKNPDSTH